MSSSRQAEPTELFASLQRSQAAIALDHKDLCFLVAVTLHLEGTGEASLSEEALRDVFERTWEHVEPDALNTQKAATERIEKLRSQRLLNRLAASRYSAESDYAPSTLANAVVEFFLEDERLTKESLDALTRLLEAELVQASRALREGSAEEVPSKVLNPLRFSVSTLLQGIRTRQTGLDREQEELRDAITERLAGSSADALEASKGMLEGMAATLNELKQVLMRDCARLQELVGEIADTAVAAEQDEVVTAARTAADNLHRLEGWGQTRFDTWSEYHEHVLRHIRMVVSLDPNRSLSHALRELMREGPTWKLRACRAPRWRGLREVDRRSPPVRISRAEREVRALPEVEAAPPEGLVELEVREALRRGPVRYVELARDLLPRTPAAQRYAMLGQLARQLAVQGRVQLPRGRGWHEACGYRVQDWFVAPRGDEG